MKLPFRLPPTAFPVVTAPPVPAPAPAPTTYATTVAPGQTAGSVTYTSAVATSALLFTGPLSSGTQPDPATMLVFAPGGAPQIGQVDFNGADTGHSGGFTYQGKTYDVHFTRGSLTLS